MHIQAKHFTYYVKDIFSEFFNQKNVLDVGGGDINGNNRELFTDCNIVVNDVYEAPNVTIVSKTKDLSFPSYTFDTIVSTECFEHDPEYEMSFLKILELLKPGGLFFFTCASIGRPEHGTIRNSPNESYGTISNKKDMINYYRNLSTEDIDKVLKLNDNFEYYSVYYNESSYDLYFVGIKKYQQQEYDIPTYLYPYVINTKTSHNIHNELSNSFNKFNTDKNQNFHNYSRQYEKLLKDYKNKKVNILEIGVANGESILSWKDYFTNYKNVVGIDINPNCKKYEDLKNNIHIEISNVRDIDVNYLYNKYNKFDIIIDDGSHHIDDVIITFEKLFPILKENGIYIVEDTCVINDVYLSSNFYNINHLNYFFLYTQKLNIWRKLDISGHVKDNCVDPFKVVNISVYNHLQCMVDKIEFGCSYIAISKRTRYHWL